MAQDKPFVRFDEDAGLANNKVKSILKDKNGFLWIGTDNGLSKYDGQKFVNFRKGEGLPGNRIWALATDADNKIYIGCYRDGLAVIDNNKVTAVYHLPSVFPNSIRRLYYSEYYKMLVVGTDSGIYLFKDKTFYEIPYPKHPGKKASILSIIEYKHEFYFTTHTAGGKSGIFKILVNRENISHSVAQRIDYEIGMKFSLTVLNDTLYSNRYFRIYAYPMAHLFNKQIIVTANEQFMPWVSCPISATEILMGGYGEGVFMSELKIFNTYTRELTKAPYKIDTQSINDLLYDKESEIIWVCSDNGLYALLKNPIEMQELSDIPDVISIAQQNNEIYILSKNGLYAQKNGKCFIKFSRAEIAKTVYGYRDKIYFKEKSSDQKMFNDWPFNLHGLTFDKNRLFLVTTKGSISIPDLGSYLPFDSPKFSTDDYGGAYFIADYEKLRYFPVINKTLKYTQIQGEHGAISDVLKVLRVGEVFYFCSFYNGVYAIKDNKVFYLNESNSSLDNNLTDIDTTSSGEIWCTSSNGNLYNIGFDGNLIIKRKLNQQNSGIVGENYKWLKFNDHNLYVGSNRGLSIIPTTILQYRIIDSVQFYNAVNGFDFISAGNPFKDSHGSIYIHTSDKLIKINNTQFKSANSKLVFQNILLNNNTVSIKSLAGKTLPFSTNQIELEFSIIRYPSSKNMSYRYRVNNAKWNEGNKITLQSLKSGFYTIDVEAKDIENNRIYAQQIHFQIALPFWQQWWFITLISIVLITAIYSFVKWRIHKVNKQNEEKNRLMRKNSELQIQSLQVQMNPHFIFNSLNSIQNFILSSNTNDAVFYLGNLGSIIRMNLENVSEEFIHLDDEVKFLGKYIELEKMRFKEKLDIRLTNSIKDQSILIPPMLVQPIIENAIKHGVRNLKTKGLIQVEFTVEKGLLLVNVEDNGIGRKQAKTFSDDNHKSIGLSLTQQRLMLLNDKNNTSDFKLDIIDLHDNGQPLGTKVQITLQLVRAT